MGICDECIIKDGCKFANSGLIMTHCKNFIGEAPQEHGAIDTTIWRMKNEQMVLVFESA